MRDADSIIESVACPMVGVRLRIEQVMRATVLGNLFAPPDGIGRHLRRIYHHNALSSSHKAVIASPGPSLDENILSQLLQFPDLLNTLRNRHQALLCLMPTPD